MVRLLRASAVPLMLVDLIALSGVALGRIYADGLLAQLIAGAALGSVATGVAARRRPSWTVAPTSVLLLAGYTVLTVRITADRAELTDPLPAIIADALTNGIPRLLTAMIPVEATPETVLVPVISAWLAGLAGTEAAVRAGRVLLGCVPAAALYAGALYVVGPNAAAAGWPSVLFAALVVVGLATSKPGDGTNLGEVPAATRAAVRMRTLAAATAGLTVVVVSITLVSPWAGDRVTATPVDPRRYVEPPLVDSLDESPLNRISGWSLTPSERLLEVSADADPAATRTATAESVRLRLAVLADYDGITWRVGATYRNAGRVLPPQPVLPDAAVEEVRQEITIDGLTGRLLPAVPTPSEVQGTRVAFDPVTGTLIRPESLAPGLRYTVTSQRQTADLNLLPAADSPAGDAVARYLAVGAGVPDSIQRLADQLAEGNGAAFDRAVAIEEFLAEHYRKVPDAPSGHAYPNLSYFLFGPREQGGQIGTSEQFAASYAVLARLTGLPSRVVVGFDAPAGGGTVTAGDAIAWPEVLFDDLGWVAFDPLPKSENPPRPVEEDLTPKPTTLPPSRSEPPPPSDEPSTSAAPTRLAAGPERGVPVAVVAGGLSGSALLALVGAAVAVVLLRRALRRRRLTTGPPDDRINGAWLEFTDALRLAGHPVPGHLAATEAAAFAATALPSRPLLRRGSTGGNETTGEPLPSLSDLVAGVNTVAFAPGSADDDRARRAGDQAVRYVEALRDGRCWWRRAWWTIHPGPLRWHRPDRRPGITEGRRSRQSMPAAQRARLGGQHRDPVAAARHRGGRGAGPEGPMAARSRAGSTMR